MKPEQQLRYRSVSSLHTLTILFEDPFWIGIFEKTEDNQMQVCKVTFGEIRLCLTSYVKFHPLRRVKYLMLK